MEKNNNIKYYGWLPIIAGGGMFAYWILFALFLPMKDPYVIRVLDNDWNWINLMGFIAPTSGIFAILVIYSYHSCRKTIDQLGLCFTITGIVILTSILFFEAFILKGIAIEDPELINLDGSFYKYTWFRMANLSGGILLTIGIMLLGGQLLKHHTFKKWKTLMLIFALPLFGLVVLPGNIRLLGVLLYSTSLIAIGIEMTKKQMPTKN